jgi:hypothetical protein
VKTPVLGLAQARALASLRRKVAVQVGLKHAAQVFGHGRKSGCRFRLRLEPTYARNDPRRRSAVLASVKPPECARTFPEIF